MSDVASGRRMGKTWATMTAFEALTPVLWSCTGKTLEWLVSEELLDFHLTHAELRHVRRCERAKVSRPFWPRR